jgi:hypothetical protein
MDFQQGYLVGVSAQHAATTNTFAFACQHVRAHFRELAQMPMRASIFLTPSFV